jgi:hypothetical protein
MSDYVQLNGFDILRWDAQELIAVDSSPICVVNTLRFDFKSRTVTASSTLKGDNAAAKDPFCKDVNTSTAFLGGAFFGKTTTE